MELKEFNYYKRIAQYVQQKIIKNTGIFQEDLVSEAIMKMWRQRNYPYNPAKRRNFEIKIAKHAMLDFLKAKENRINECSLDEPTFDEEDGTHIDILIDEESQSRLEESFARKTLSRYLKPQLACLDAKKRGIVDMYLGEHKQTTIAKSFGVGQSYVNKVIKTFHTDFENMVS